MAKELHKTRLPVPAWSYLVTVIITAVAVYFIFYTSLPAVTGNPAFNFLLVVLAVPLIPAVCAVLQGERLANDAGPVGWFGSLWRLYVASLFTLGYNLLAIVMIVPLVFITVIGIVAIPIVLFASFIGVIIYILAFWFGVEMKLSITAADWPWVFGLFFGSLASGLLFLALRKLRKRFEDSLFRLFQYYYKSGKTVIHKWCRIPESELELD